ncbi:glycosyltransferase family 2 protein [Haloarcula brevis]|uniref:glycosyltransferase family 2 protein n=1 Tax=Haloarcula brevis TaxID=3111453 RepID=UPI00300F4CB1
MEPLVSAVIPTYNRAEYVGGAVESALHQTYDRVEVVVVNDGSTDATPEVLAEYADYDRVRVLHNDRNRGIPYTMNRGIEAARGEYIGVFGDDDRWRPRKVERQIAVMAECDSSYCGVYTGGVIVDDDGTVVEQVQTGASGDVYPDVLVRMSILPHSSQLVRADCLHEIGGFDTEFSVACDWDLTVRLAKRWKFAYVPETLVERIHHGDNVTGDPAYDIRARCRMAEKHRDALDAVNAESARAFEAARRRELGLYELHEGDRTAALGHFVSALRLQPTGGHASLALTSVLGLDGLRAARRLRDAVLTRSPVGEP